jgi:hypothetical protein
MKEDSGNFPDDPRVMPAPPDTGSLPSGNGPLDAGSVPPPTLPTLDAPQGVGLGSLEKQSPEQKDSFREIVETIVFVVVLVLLLRSFLAEAFVIPTGSMATTLVGYQREIHCPECGFRFPLNMHQQHEGQAGSKTQIRGCTCPNCRLHIDATNSTQFSANGKQE